MAADLEEDLAQRRQGAKENHGKYFFLSASLRLGASIFLNLEHLF